MVLACEKCCRAIDTDWVSEALTDEHGNALCERCYEKEHPKE